MGPESLFEAPFWEEEKLPAQKAISISRYCTELLLHRKQCVVSINASNNSRGKKRKGRGVVKSLGSHGLVLLCTHKHAYTGSQMPTMGLKSLAAVNPDTT